MEENKPKRHYKVEPGDNLVIYRQDINGISYYKAMVTKTNQDGTKSRFYKELRFKKGVEIANKTMIKVNDFFEDIRQNPRDKYNPIFSLVILDFEIVENPFDKTTAISNYNNNQNNEIDDSYFADVANQEEEIETPF